jgi:Fur family zinc uptake transcriptional regulator
MKHNHNKCFASAISSAENLCEKLGVRLTKSRKRVLEIIWQSHKATKAYDILEILSKEDKSAKPPTVYRALEFLQQHCLVHKIESLNAYVGCANNVNDTIFADKTSHALGGQFLICNKCGVVTEFFDEKIYSLVSQNANNHNFKPTLQSLEVHGTCKDCQ